MEAVCRCVDVEAKRYGALGLWRHAIAGCSDEEAWRH